MRFVNDDKFRAMVEEDLSATVLFDVVYGNDLEGIGTEHVLAIAQFLLQTAHCASPDDDGIKAKLVLDFVLPLLAQMRQTQHRETPDLLAVKQFLGNQQRLQSLTDTHIITDEQSDAFLLQCQYQRHHLVGAWRERQLSQTLERPCNIPKRQTASVI